MTCRWFGDPVAEAGLRFVGYADEVAPRHVRHAGWYVDDLQSEVCRGVVYQLPARKGRARFVYGYADPYCDTGDGRPACLAVDDVVWAVPVVCPSGYIYDGADDARDEAARRADTEAEFYAERKRGWVGAYNAGYAARVAAIDARGAVARWAKAVRRLRALWPRRAALRADPATGGVIVALIGAVRLRRGEACRAAEEARMLRREAPGGGQLRDAWLAGYDAAA